MKKLGFFLILLLVIAAGGGIYFYNQSQLNSTPSGLVKSNGRLQMQRIDVAGLIAGRIESVDVEEGEHVLKDQPLVKIRYKQYESKLKMAEADHERAQASIAQIKEQRKAQSEELKIAELDLKNAKKLRADNLVSNVELEKRQHEVVAKQAAQDALLSAQTEAEAAAKAALAQIEAMQITIDDLQVKAPIDGVVQYRFAEPGKVTDAGHPLISLLNPADSYMTLYLSTNTINKIQLNDEARIVIDGLNAVWPAKVSFVSNKAQFTPKFVETDDERQKLMYKIKVKLEKEVANDYQNLIKSGLTGKAWLKTDSQDWPQDLQPKLPKRE